LLRASLCVVPELTVVNNASSLLQACYTVAITVYNINI
jgi:hypothetical protein